MKVVIINGSPRVNGNSARLLEEAANIFAAEGIETVRFDIGANIVRGCVACGACNKLGKCVFDDIVNDVAEVLRDADGLMVASPVYYASANGTLVSLLDRLFRSASYDLRMKVGAAFAVARRAGTVATFDELNKYFTINQMPVASGRYWNNGFGGAQGEIAQDEEGLQNARIVARNMVFLMKSIALGKETFGLPAAEDGVKRTSFIR